MGGDSIRAPPRWRSVVRFRVPPSKTGQGEIMDLAKGQQQNVVHSSNSATPYIGFWLSLLGKYYSWFLSSDSSPNFAFPTWLPQIWGLTNGFGYWLCFIASLFLLRWPWLVFISLSTICLSIYLSFYLFIYPSIYLSLLIYSCPLI